MKGKVCEFCGFNSSIFEGILERKNDKCPNCQNEGLPYLLSQKRSELNGIKQKQRKCKQLKSVGNFEVDGCYTDFCVECWKFEKEDFIEIEEQKKDNSNSNDYQMPEKNDDNQNGDENQKPSNGNGSNGNNSNRNKNKNSSNPNIPNSVKEYFQKNKVKSVELDGENWIITYQDKKEKKTILVVDVLDLQDLKGYLQSQGINSISAAELNITEDNSFANKHNETKYWPWILGIGGILAIGIVIWAVHKKQRKK